MPFYNFVNLLNYFDTDLFRQFLYLSFFSIINFFDLINNFSNCKLICLSIIYNLQYKQKMQKRQIASQKQEDLQLQSVDTYDQECLLDKGGQGQVHLMSKNHQLFAVKLPLQNTNITKFEKEQLILSNMNHQNIIKFYQYKEGATVRYSNKMQIQQPAMVLQFAEQGDLFYLAYKKRFSEPVCRVLFEQIMSALKYIHQQKKLMHLDMKVENILVDSSFNLKISDFGHAMFYQQIEQGAVFGYGTDLFRPPQYGYPTKFKGQKVDVFNAGMILFQLIVGRQPLYSRQQPFRHDKIYRLIKNRKFDSFWRTFENQLKINISDNAKRLLMSMLSEDPAQRPTINQIFKQQWFIQTKPATHEQVVGQFMPKKQKLLALKKKQLIQQIKTKFNQKKNTQQKGENKRGPKNANQIKKQEKSNQQGNYREANQFFIRMYQDLSNNKLAFTNIQKKNKFQVTYFKTNPSLLVCMLKNVVHDLFESGQLIPNDELFKISHLGHHIQLQNIQRGTLKATFEYEMKSLINPEQLQNVSSEFTAQKVEQEDQDVTIYVEIQGQIIEKEGRFGIEWFSSNTKNYYLWKKEIIAQLNCICSNLLA